MPAWVLLAATAALAPPVPDHELATMRGGFALPTGLSVAMAVQSDTRVDGTLVLRTVYSIDHGAPALQVFAPRDASKTNREAGGASAPTNPGVSLTFDRQNGARFGMTTSVAPNVQVSTGSATGIGMAGDAGAPVNLDSGSVQVPAGVLDVTRTTAGQRVHLSGDGIDVTHLVGNAIGTAIANTANDRIIDTATTLGLDISGATPNNLGSSMLRVDTLGLDATAAMIPR